jgi:DNA-binding GntR family transcriptional regulator
VEALVGGLSAEMRLVIVLRFLRKRPLSAIAAQLGASAGSANASLHTALIGVAERMGLDAERCDQEQRRRHLAGESQGGQRETDAGHDQLHHDQHPAAIEHVRQRSADQAERMSGKKSAVWTSATKIAACGR